MSLSHFGAKAMLDVIIDNQANPVTFPLELALFTQAAAGTGSVPADNPAAGTEGTAANEIDPGGGYVRQTITFGTATLGSTSSISSTNGQSFPTATAPWGSTAHAAPAWIGGWVIYDTKVTPDGIWVGSFNNAKQVQLNDTVTVALGDITLQLA